MKEKRNYVLTTLVILLGIFVFSSVSTAQFGTFTKEDLIRYTPDWEGERYPDGRPKVPDEILERMKNVEIEEAWGVLRGERYNNQFAGNWFNLNPDNVLVGRAVTGTFIPHRPDINQATQDIGKELGETQNGGQNSWVIDRLIEDDVIVINMFGKIKDGTYAGGNLATSIWAKTGGTGMIIDGGIRDLGQISRIPDFGVYIRGADPTAIGEVTLASINAPTMIGEATCMPGDVVLGTIEGVIFIPPHLAETVVDRAERVNMRDAFGFEMLRSGKFTPGEIDSGWGDEINAAYTQWLKDNRTKLNVPVKSVDLLIKEREEKK